MVYILEPMEEESCHNSHKSKAPCSLIASTSSTSKANHEDSNENQQDQLNTMFYGVNISISNPFMSFMWDDVWSCIVVLVLFWLIASVTLAVGVHGSDNLQLGPYSSSLIEINSMFVQSIKVEQNNNPKPGLMLYGFDDPPPLDVKINWTEMYDATIPAKSQKEWIFYLNKDSQLDVSYNVKSLVDPLFLVIAKGRESLIEWKKDPSFPNTTLYWNNIYGSGSITQNISHSSTYYVAIGNMKPLNVKVQLKFSVNALLYNTTSSYNKCSLDKGLCRLSLDLSSKFALLTTPGPKEGVSNQEWFDVNISYEPRWIIYIIGSGVLIVQILFSLKFYKMFRTNNEENAGFRQVEVISERAPLLSSKDSDSSSWSSSYNSFSSENSDEEGKSIIEGETSNLQCLCVICFDATRDCFFLPCGHFATCFACGTRIAEETCSCPICRRKLKKVRKIYIV